MRFGAAALILLASVAVAPTSQAFVPNSFGLRQRAASASSSYTTLLASTKDDKIKIDHLVNNAINRNGVASQQDWQQQLAQNKLVVPSSSASTSTDEEDNPVDDELRKLAAIETRASAAAYLAQYENQSGAAIVYSKLQENAVQVVNGFSGGAVLPLLDQFHEQHPRHLKAGAPPPIRWITNSNEASAGHIAEGYAKSMPLDPENLPVGVAVATSGPGVTNLITPLQDGLCDGVPMVVLCGQAATTAPADAFQSADAVALTRPCTKWSYQIKSAAEIPMVMDYAFYVARNGRPGPVFVDLPKDLQNQILTSDLIDHFISAENPGNEMSFAKLKPLRKADGEIFQALHLGTDGKGLSFEVGKVKDKYQLQPVTAHHATDTVDAYAADHHPTQKIFRAVETEEINTNIFEEGDLAMDSTMTKRMFDVIRKAKKPIIVAGQGCNDAAAELQEFAETLQIPVTTTLHALGTFDERHPLALNMLGMHGHPSPNFMIQEADLVICVGSRFDDRITGRMADFIPAARVAAEEGRGGVIHVDVRLTEKAKQVPPTYFVHSTGKHFLQTMNAATKALQVEHKPATAAWLEHQQQLQKDYPIKIPAFATQEVDVTDPITGETRKMPRTRMSAQSVITELDRQLRATNKLDDTIFTTGVGIHQMVAAQLITWTQPRQMLSSGSLGTMGVALGYSIGAKLANGKKLVIAVDGDGSFNMTFTELKTLAEQKIAVKIMILDNDGQMMVEYWQRLFHDNRLIAVRNSKNPDYTMLARAFGIKSIYCDAAEDLEAKMHEFLCDNADEPVLFHVRIERTPCLPLVAPGQPLQDMILEDVDVTVDQGAAPS